MGGENGVYVYMDSPLDLLKTQAKQLGMDFDKLEQEGKITFVHVPLTKRKFELFYNIEDAVKKINAKRLVFDSLPSFVINMDLFTIPAAYAGAVASTVTTSRDLIATNSSALAASPKQESDKVVYKGDEDKRLISIIIDQLRHMETTNLIVTFASDDPGKISMDGVSEYVCDGVIKLDKAAVGEVLNRILELVKMRETKIDGLKHNFDLGENGINLE